MNAIAEHIVKLAPGSAQVYRNMAILPLKGAESALSYLTLDRALENGLKISETGSVPTLAVINATGKEVLGLQGEYILGGKQNRMLAQGFYLAKDFDGIIPVRCVQQGRWTPNASVSFETSDHYAMKSLGFMPSPTQESVWGAIGTYQAQMRVRSPTRNIEDIYQQKKENVDDFLAHFSYEHGSVGLVALVQHQGKTFFGADVFDKHMEPHFGKLIKSYALDAIQGGPDVTWKDMTDMLMTGFLSQVNASTLAERKPVSLGRDVTIQGTDVEGYGLIVRDTPVIISFGAKDKAKENPIAPPLRPHHDPWGMRPLGGPRRYCF
ncbi:MAG: DUF6569 family protein [Nanoarchaeota archaeon]